MRLFDTHAHLHFPDYAEDLDAVLGRARAAGVRGMVTIGTDRETNRAVTAQVRVGVEEPHHVPMIAQGMIVKRRRPMSWPEAVTTSTR